jgi:NADP-dependent 3-hydroxy acid dehydrogenase YdfG
LILRRTKSEHEGPFQSKTVVITGCTRGLGRAMIPRFIDAGWQIAGCGRNEAQIAELSRQFPPRIYSKPAMSHVRPM